MAERRPRRKAEETREDILNMSESLFRKRGFSSVAIADIASALNMSPANIFKHFHSKTELVDAIAARHIEALMERFPATDEIAPPPERLLRMTRHMMESHLRNLQDNPHIFEMVVLTVNRGLECGKRYHELIISAFESVIRDGVSQGVYRVEDTRKAALTVASALACVLHPVLLAKETPDILATRCKDVVDLVNAALRNPLAK